MVKRMKNSPLSAADLQAYMQAEGIQGEIVFLDAPTPTVEKAAEALGAVPDQIVKSILFLVAGKPVLGLSCGLDLIDQRVVARIYGTNRKQVKLADAETVLAITGYPVGTVPPFGHLQPIEALLDEKVLAQKVVYAGGGAHNALVRLSAAVLPKVTRASVLDLRRPDTPA
jgi:prolyl-tRNA editing enzyme YbaK/EbsC (Cys-tRNA(Pro) deacylase)